MPTSPKVRALGEVEDECGDAAADDKVRDR